MYYPEELIEEIRQKNDIVDVISGYVGLQKKGSNYVCCCPFHSEKTPSFSVNRNRQIFKCFGCGVAGTVTTFVMKYENCTFPEAVKILADKAGVELPEVTLSEEEKKRASRRQRLLELNKEAAKYYFYQLRTPRGNVAKEYLDKRQLTDETRKNFGLGYAPVQGNELIAYLRSKGFTDDLIRDVGLAKIDEKYGATTQFWNRVMFPIQDINHRVIGFGGRIMGDADGGPKYLNSPETEIFEKRRNLYGMNYARTSRAGNIILCEGYMDVIQMHQAGFTQAVASLGTAFTPGQAALIKKYTSDVLLAYDSDGAGTNAALKAIRILRDAGMNGKIINMSPYKDPDEFIKNMGKEAFQDRIDHAENSFMFEIRILARNYNMDDPTEKTNFHKEIAGRLCEFSEDVERENYLEAVAEKYNIGFDNLRKLVVNTAAKNGGYEVIREQPRSGIQSKRITSEENVKNPQRLLITWLVEYPQVYPKIKDIIKLSDFTNDLYKTVAGKVFTMLDNNQEVNSASIVDMYQDEKEQIEAASLFTTQLQELESEQDREKAFHDIVVRVKENSLKNITDFTEFLTASKELEKLRKTHISLI